MAEDTGHPNGRVVRVIGPVVDVEFPPTELPDIYTALKVDVTLEDATTTITCEVAQHIGDNVVRAIALKPTDGLTRGAPVREHRARRSAFRSARACSATSTTCSASRSTPTCPTSTRTRTGRSTATPPPFADLEPKKVMLETGIKVIDLLEPYVQGGKIGMFGGAGVGKTVIIQEMIRRQARAARRRVGVRRRRRAHPRGQRPLPGDDRVRRHREDRAGVRPDGRAARRAAARRALRAHDGRVLPRREAPGRAAVRGQHLPVHAGGVRGLDAARPHAERGRLPAEPGRRDGRAAGADHVGRRPFDHVVAGDLRAGRRHHGPGAARGVRAPGRHDRALARHRVARHLPGRRPARLEQPHPRPALRRRGALRGRPARPGDPAALQGPAGHHRHPRDRRAVRGGQGHRHAGPQDPEVPVAADVRRRAVHGPARASTRRSTRRSRRSRGCARASTTTCPSRRSSWSVGSKRPSRRRSRWRPRNPCRSRCTSSRPNARSGPVRPRC